MGCAPSKLDNNNAIDSSTTRDRKVISTSDQIPDKNHSSPNTEEKLIEDKLSREVLQTENENKPKREHVKTTPKHTSQDFNLNFEDFRSIDEHARNAPKSAEESLFSLATYLIKPAKNNLEKVRAIYVWICENISYDTEAFFSGNLSAVATNSEDVLKCKSSVCEGYASLFQSLCIAIGITCKKISGYAKGYGHRPGDVISYNNKTNHAWNVVDMDGSWRFIESTWGAGHVDKNKKFQKVFSNFYFLTPPESFIVDHFPYIDNDIEESKRWQLLQKPLTIDVYSKIIKPSKEARQYDIKFPSHPYEIITVADSCSVIVVSDLDNLRNVWYDFLDNTGALCNEYVMVVKETSMKYAVTVRPKCQGQFILKIYATIEKCDKSTQLVEYIVNCVSVETDFKPYPKNHGYYGLKPNFIERGFKMSNQLLPFQTCKAGQIEMKIETTTMPETTVTLFDSDGNDLKDFTLLEQTDNCIFLRARFTRVCYHKLTVFSKFGDDQTYSEAFTCLILNSNTSEITSPFPQSYTTTRKYKCRLIQPLVRDIPANSEVNFEFICENFTKLLVNKTIYLKDNNDVWKLTVLTGDSGKLALSGKPQDENVFWPVYEFVIKS